MSVCVNFKHFVRALFNLFKLISGNEQYVSFKVGLYSNDVQTIELQIIDVKNEAIPTIFFIGLEICVESAGAFYCLQINHLATFDAHNQYIKVMINRHKK